MVEETQRKRDIRETERYRKTQAGVRDTEKQGDSGIWERDRQRHNRGPGIWERDRQTENLRNMRERETERDMGERQTRRYRVVGNRQTEKQGDSGIWERHRQTVYHRNMVESQTETQNYAGLWQRDRQIKSITKQCGENEDVKWICCFCKNLTRICCFE